MSGHVISKNVYFAIFAALLLLTGLTTGVAYINLGAWNTPAALAIACVKASLVLLFFMHLRWSTQLNRVVWLSAILWLGLLIGITSIDFLTRSRPPVPEPWNSSAASAPVTPAESMSQR